MTEHGFMALGDVLRKLGVSLAPAEAADFDPEPVAGCARCRDAGWVSRDGQTVPCPCGLIQQRRMARIWASSQVPETMRGYTLDSFLLHPRNRHRAQLVADIRGVWRDSDRWLLFVGSVGLGKTGLGVSLLLEHVRAGSGGLYVVTPSYLSRIRSTYTRVRDGEVDEMDVLASVIEAPLLMLDDLGKVALSEWGQEKLFTLVNERYLAGRRTIVTSNLDMHDDETTCKDGCRCLEAHLWPATWDRLRGSSEVFRLTGESLR